jgi:hypothetical protein
MTIINLMTLDECLEAKNKEENILNRMIEQIPKVGMAVILEQERKLDSLDYWIERKRLQETAE